MKKLLYVFIIVCFLIGIKETVYAEVDAEGFDYEIINGYATITGYNGNGGNIHIPDTLGGFSVKVIGEYAFRYNANITNITMPDTIITLGRGAFLECSALKEINLSAKVVYIGINCFLYCPELVAININKTHKSGYFSAEGVLFYRSLSAREYFVQLVTYPGNKKDDVYVVPDYVTDVASFSSLQNLRILIIPASVTTLYLMAIDVSAKPIDIILKHEKVPHMGLSAFCNLASGTRIICKTEEIREKAASEIYNYKGADVTAVLATEEDLISATELELTSVDTITLNPGESIYVSWRQTPANTTDNVTWQSSDSQGLIIDKHTGRIKAKYRGEYTVTGSDGKNEISVQIKVPFIKDYGKIFITDFTANPDTEWENDWLETNTFRMGEIYGLRYISNYTWLEQGIVYNSGFTTDWKISKKGELWNSIDGRYSNVDICFKPYESGEYIISYTSKDKDGTAILAQGEKTIQVIGKNTTTFTGTTSYKKTFGDKDFTLDIKPNAGQALQYASANTKVATVTPQGTMSIEGAGNTTITVRAASNTDYTDAEQKVIIEVNKRSIRDTFIGKVADQPYTGKEIKPAIEATYNGSKLKIGTDYTVSYKNNTKTGAATIMVTGNNNFSGSKEITFQIVAVGRPSSLVQKTGGKTTTTSIQLTWEKVNGAEGYQIFRSTKKNDSFIKVATITNGSATTYTDKKLKSGTTYYFKICAYRKISGQTKKGAYTIVLKAATKPGKVSLTVKSGSRRAILSWKQVKGASGYEILRSTSQNGKYSKIKILAKGSTKAHTNMKLSGNKVYYYRVRAYRIADKTKVYGAYSSVKSIRVKK